MAKETWLIFQKDQLLLDQHNTFLDESALPLLKAHFVRAHRISASDADIYCAELLPGIKVPDQYQLVLFKKALGLFGDNWYSVATKAYSVLHWDKMHQFCGACGGNTAHRPNSLERVCTQCGHLFYPRISPSIIVLIQKDDKILMARSPHFAPGAFGLIAGFVEAGESLEEAVHREVKEETNLRIKNLRYFASQSWPFPDSLMVGFIADYDSGELIINHDEIEVGGWYGKDELPGRPSVSVSIGSKMIDYWLDCNKS